MADINWPELTHRVAIHLLGDPNPKVSSPQRGEIRWGEHGRFSLLVYPHPKAGHWEDWRAGVGGGLFDLLQHELNLDKDAGIEWLKSNGYLDGTAKNVQPPVNNTRELQENAARRRQEAQNAALRAQAMVNNARSDYHPYLSAKGFRGFRGLVDRNGLLLVPMWTMKGREIRAVQTIDADGGKRFAPKGCAVANTAHFLGGRRGLWWWCEGYATGLSILEVLKTIYRSDDRVVIAFSAGAIAKYAKHGVVVAEHDRYTCRIQGCHNRWFGEWGETACPKCGTERIDPPAGERAARVAGLPFWKPPIPGHDANDYWLKEGTATLADHFRELVMVAVGTAKPATI